MLEIGTKIRELRKSKKLTQKDLAKVLNVTPQAVSKWERNESNPDLQTLLDISNYFKVSVDEIMGKKSRTFFDSLFSKKEGSKKMEKKQAAKPEKARDTKKVLIFDLVVGFIADKGLLQTQILNQKLNLMMMEKEQPVEIDTYTSNLINKHGAEADVILLTPTFGYAKAEIEGEFPETPVIAITKRDYGILNVEKIYDEIITALT